MFRIKAIRKSLRILFANLTVIFAVFFIIWISFIPEPLKYRYDISVKLVLIALLALSLLKHKFDLKDYFIYKNKLFWIYLFLFSLNIWFAKDRLTAYKYYSDFIIMAVLIYFLIINEFKTEYIKKILYFLCLCATLVSLIGFLEMIFKSNIIYERFIDNYYYGRFIFQGRMMSTLIHPNILGSYFIGCIPLSFYFYKKATGSSRYVNLAIFLFILSGAFLTFSRGTWFACLIMISIVMLVKKRVAWLIFIWVAALLFSLLVSYPFFSENFRYRFGMEYLWEYLKSGHRTNAYIATVRMIEQHPFVGVGLNHYRMLFNQYLNISLPRELIIPDSIYLMHLAEAGLLGFAGFIIFLTDIIKKGSYCCRNLNSDFKDMSFAILVGFAALLFNMAFFDGFLWKTPFYLFWLSVGILGALYKNSYSSATLSHE